MSSVTWNLSLGRNHKEIERQVYTFMTLIGDVGGFNGAIILFPTFFMSFYSSFMFNQSIEKELPTRRTNKKASLTLRDRLSENVPIEALT